MSLDETGYTSFQIKPSNDSDNYQAGRCMFRGDAFCLDSINFISAVGTLGGITCFSFTVELEIYSQPSKVFQYDFASRAEALRAQRELSRAYCRVEEFSYARDTGVGTERPTVEDKG